VLRLARRVASRSNHRFQHSALVFRGGALVAFGYNHDGRHAEVSALSKLWPSNRKGTTLFSLRFLRNGRLGLALPCPKCQVFLKQSGVSRVYFSTSDGRILKGGKKP
jgi:pyrimidine deaminase RibD-like protein